MLVKLVLLAAALAAPADTPTASVPTPDSFSSGTAEVRIVNQAARWTGLLAMDELKDDSATMFLISGEIENVGPGSVVYVKLGYELLADRGDGEVVLATEYGYNFRAEALRSAAVEAGEVSPTMVPVRPLGPGEKDLFRMVFFRSDVPKFDRWRVRILEVK